MSTSNVSTCHLTSSFQNHTGSHPRISCRLIDQPIPNRSLFSSLLTPLPIPAISSNLCLLKVEGSHTCSGYRPEHIEITRLIMLRLIFLSKENRLRGRHLVCSCKAMACCEGIRRTSRLCFYCLHQFRGLLRSTFMSSTTKCYHFNSRDSVKFRSLH